MLSLLPLLALAAVASAATLARDGPRSFPWSPSGRIVDGEDTTIDKVPYQISLQAFGQHICGGSIISKHWIVTAGHCADYPIELYYVKAGSSHQKWGGSNHRVASIVIHEDYSSNESGIPINDIALMRVSKPFAFDETRQPIALFNEYEESPIGAMAVITGWGAIVQDGGSPNILQTVSIPVVAKAECNKAYNSWGGLPKNQICAAYPEGGKDSCQGDSGGPMAIAGRLSGITSWGNGCAISGRPGVYTEVAAHRAWIKRNSGL